jgi:hypothetical protein
MSGKILDSEIWVNTLTLERIAALERNFQANRHAERRRIDARFGTEVRNKRYQVPELAFRPTRPPAPALTFAQRCDRLIRAMELQAAARDRRNKLFEDIVLG